MNSYVNMVRNKNNDLEVCVNEDETIIFENCSKELEEEVTAFVNRTDKGLLVKLLIDTYPNVLYENKYFE